VIEQENWVEKRFRICAIVFSLNATFAQILCGASPAYSQQGNAAPNASPADLTQHPGRYVGRPVVWVKGYCFFNDPVYACVGEDTPFVVFSPKIEPAEAKADIEANCGGDNGYERNPKAECAYTIQFVATAFKPIIDDYVLHDRVQQNKRLIRFEAPTVQTSR
jgi:hypothetical protein